MPKKKSVYSLKRYCLRNIAFNMENYWCSDFKNFADQVKGQFTFVIGPFEYMCALITFILEKVMNNEYVISNSSISIFEYSE